jgi:hypothetical protein
MTWLNVQVDSQPPVRFAIDSMYRAWAAADTLSRLDKLSSERHAGPVRVGLALKEIFASGQGDTLRIRSWSAQLLLGEPR